MKRKQSLDRTKSGLSFSYSDTSRNLADSGALVPSHLAVYANFSEIMSEISQKLLHLGVPTKPVGRNGDKRYGLQKPETFKFSFHDSTCDSTKGLPGIGTYSWAKPTESGRKSTVHLLDITNFSYQRHS